MVSNYRLCYSDISRKNHDSYGDIHNKIVLRLTVLTLDYLLVITRIKTLQK